MTPLARPLAAAAPRRPLPRLSLHQFLLPHPSSTIRHASTTPKPLSAEFRRRQAAQQAALQKGTPVIPQPDRFRPPSHSSSYNKKLQDPNLANKNYGPRLTDEDRKRMRTKKYPNMMSAPGTFSYWFFNTKWLHAVITLTLLSSFALWSGFLQHKKSSIYAHLYPPFSDIYTAPVATVSRFIEVYRMHLAQGSEELARERHKHWEDVQKRREYRLQREREAEERGEEYVPDPKYYVGSDGIRRRRVKRWFGIWE